MNRKTLIAALVAATAAGGLFFVTDDGDLALRFTPSVSVDVVAYRITYQDHSVRDIPVADFAVDEDDLVLVIDGELPASVAAVDAAGNASAPVKVPGVWLKVK